MGEVKDMVIVRVNMMTGRSAEQKRALIAELTETVVRRVEVPAEAVRVVLVEVPRDAWGIGGVPAAELRPEG